MLNQLLLFLIIGGVTLLNETGCQGGTVATLDYPGPGGAIQADLSSRSSLSNGDPLSILLAGPILEGSRLFAGFGLFGENDNTVVTFLPSVHFSEKCCAVDSLVHLFC